MTITYRAAVPSPNIYVIPKQLRHNRAIMSQNLLSYGLKLRFSPVQKKKAKKQKILLLKKNNNLFTS